MKKNISIFCFLLISLIANAQRPNVWIITDMSDKTLPGKNKEGTINDPDDISAMAGYLLLANEFNTRGITVTSTHHAELKNVPNQAIWAENYFGKAYKTDLKKLLLKSKDYPKGVVACNKYIINNNNYINIYQSSLKESAEKFKVGKHYDINSYPSVKLLLDELSRTDKNNKQLYSSENPLDILCWGSLTEPAILTEYCINNGEKELLKNLRFIAHWTNSSLHQGTKECPECVANCREDANACRYLKELAMKGDLKYYELGAIGQHGIVSGSQKGHEYYDQFKTSNLGEIFATGKFANNCVDDSDCATYYVLLGRWGLNINNFNDNGTNSPEIELKNEKVFYNKAHEIRNDLLDRCR